MPLLDLRTNLKSLKYGNDRPGGGNSGQPYIQKPLAVDYNQIPIGDGVVLTSVSTLQDVSRLTKMFFDLKSSKGSLFILNQNLLSRTGVQTQASPKTVNEGAYLPTSTLAQAGVSATGLHFNKQGLNPVPGTFGSLPTYSDKVSFTQESEDNRLVEFYNSKIIVSPSSSINELYNYDGGPGSILGVGKTSIQFSDQRTGINNVKFKDPFFIGKSPRENKRNKEYFSSGSYIPVPDNNYDNFLRFTRLKSVMVGEYAENRKLIYENEGFAKIDRTIAVTISGSIPGVSDKIVENVLNYKEIYQMAATSSQNPVGARNMFDFRTILRDTLNGYSNTSGSSSILSDAPSYFSQNIETRVNIGGTSYRQGPGYKKGKNLYSYTNGSGIGPIDRINHYPIYYSDGAIKNKDAPINDLVKFRIALIDAGNPNKQTFMHFRAFLNSITDNYSATWNPYNYVGRGEKFYTYGGFDRTLSLSWTVAAQSKEELSPMYKKLNYLASTLAPSYSPSGYMRGPLVQLTIGGYVYEQVGFITGLTYEIGEDSPWEIGIADKGIDEPLDKYDKTVKELPHYIRVSSFNFTPIHNFVPKTQDAKDWNGKSRFIALDDGGGNNLYKNPPPSEKKNIEDIKK